MAESTGENTVTCEPSNNLKHPLVTPDKCSSLMPRAQTVSSNITSTADSGPQCRSELIPSSQAQDSNIGSPAKTTLSPRHTILHPTIGLPKGYTPIPTLLAKSVGNKVTLMKRPADCSGVNSVDGQKKNSLVSLPTSVVATTKPSKAQSSPSISQKNSQQMQAQELQQTQVLRHSGMATVMATLPKLPQTKSNSPVQMVYKVPEGLSHQVMRDSNGPVKIAVHPVVEKNTAEKVMQQMVILPSNLLIHKAEEKAPSSHEQSKDIQVPVSKVQSSLCISTNVPGYTIPENRIPVQQVAPLKGARTTRDLFSSVTAARHQRVLNTGGHKGTKVCTQSVMPNLFSITTPSISVSAEPIKSKDPKQELKTVCIRDSQSILVTTRGGNTGIVKVQTSSDHSALGSLPTSPVITISPQFKAFLISKTSPTPPPSDPSQTSLCTSPTATSFSVAQPQEQVPSVIKSPTVTSSMFTAVSGSIPITGRGSHTAGCTVALNQGSNTSDGSKVGTKTGQLAQTTAPGSQFQGSLVKNAVVVPSLSSSGVSQNLTQVELISKKRPSTDERSQVTKFILVTPPCSTPNLALSKGTHSTNTSAKSVTSSGVMFISQPSATSSTTFMGRIPKTLKTGLSPVSGGNSEALSKGKNISLPSGGFI